VGRNRPEADIRTKSLAASELLIDLVRIGGAKF
jgi:hypothetical protein